jgi:hypothetical protein
VPEKVVRAKKPLGRMPNYNGVLDRSIFIEYLPLDHIVRKLFFCSKVSLSEIKAASHVDFPPIDVFSYACKLQKITTKPLINLTEKFIFNFTDN